MRKDLLRQYVSIKKEIQEMEQRIDRDIRIMRELDSAVVKVRVRGGRGNQQKYDVEGKSSEYSKIRTRCLSNRLKREKRVDELKDIAEEIEDYTKNIDDAETRRLIMFRYIDGMTWQEVAKAMGDGWTPDACRIKHQRFLDKE